jgi:histidinol-phosphatase
MSPTASDFTDDLRLAHVLADDADSLTTARFKALDLHVMSKPDLTPVTDADEGVEEAIRRTLSRVR